MILHQAPHQGLVQAPTAGFPKTARLLKHREFYFKQCLRFQTEHFKFFYSTSGRGRMGVSLSKKIMKTAVARNRVRRLLREVFRQDRSRVGLVDVHVVGREGLKSDWPELDKGAVEKEFRRWEESVLRPNF
jgi:ribonuclease P protein component